jgi:hypothetical protein
MHVEVVLGFANRLRFTVEAKLTTVAAVVVVCQNFIVNAGLFVTLVFTARSLTES